ncbi:hypothetical protein [Oceanobacillus sp. 1P07AA]|uniref:hypothetical protein n=1 Tax=Oceanobacillus sp. 1P07AA TaxID=3132293 RepID=UPI0039A482B2
MEFIREYAIIHIRDNFFFYLVLTLILTWNYFLLPETIPYYIYSALAMLFGESALILLIANLVFIFVLSLLFIYPNKLLVEIQEFKKDKYRRRYFWICQLISVVIIIFIRQIYEVVITMVAL